jgi:hypothetical protein
VEEEKNEALEAQKKKDETEGKINQHFGSLFLIFRVALERSERKRCDELLGRIGLSSLELNFFDLNLLCGFREAINEDFAIQHHS